MKCYFKYSYTLLLILFFTSLSAQDIVETSFSSLNEVKPHQDILIRGFLYQSKEGQWILAGEPNLRSCCVGAKHKISQQLVLEGNYDPQQINRVIAVRGVVDIQEGKYVLTHVQVQKTRDHTMVYLILALAIGWCFMGGLRRT